MSGNQPRSATYPEAMPMTSAELIKALDRVIPPVQLNHAVTEEGRDDLNWALARRSVVDDLLRSLKKSQEPYGIHPNSNSNP